MKKKFVQVSGEELKDLIKDAIAKGIKRGLEEGRASSQNEHYAIETYILSGPPASGKTTRAKEIIGNRLGMITNNLTPSEVVEVLVVDEIPSVIAMWAAYHWIQEHQYQFPDMKTLVLITQQEVSTKYNSSIITVECF